MITTAAIVFAVNILASFLKRSITPKWGIIGTQVTVFILALIGALYYTFSGVYPGLQAWVVQGLEIFAISVAFYEVILSKIPVFKGSPTA